MHLSCKDCDSQAFQHAVAVCNTCHADAMTLNTHMLETLVLLLTCLLCLPTEAFQNPDKCLGQTFVAKPELLSNSDVARVITQVIGTEFSYYFMPDEKARSLPFPGAVAMSNMFEFWRTCEPALQERDALPFLGQGQSIQDFVKEHAQDFAAAFKNAKQVG